MFLINDYQMDDHELKQRVLQKEKEWLTVMQERYLSFIDFSFGILRSFDLDSQHWNQQS